MADNKEIYDLLEHRIPEARQQLRDSHRNLGDLATYCERNYIDSGQTGTALEETKRYAAQSLASVAYQVNVLAVGMLELLDKQMKHLGDMEANIHHISQARNEIESSYTSLCGPMMGVHMYSGQGRVCSVVCMCFVFTLSFDHALVGYKLVTSCVKGPSFSTLAINNGQLLKEYL